jgi:hypothetical protein
MEKILLIVEKSKGELFGRVQYDDNLLVDSGKTVDSLEKKFRKLLNDFHDIDPDKIAFEHVYDISALFEAFGYLNITSIAKKAAINPGLLRQYASGVKFASPTQAKKLEDTIHQIGKELSGIMVYAG